MKDKTEIIQQAETLPAAPITPATMLQMAVEKGASLEQLEKFMDLAERHEKAEAEKAYTQAMAEFRAKCPSITKTKKAHNSKYAGLAETIAQVKNLLTGCGLSHSWRTNQDSGVISVTCKVTHVRGHSEETTLAAGADTSGSKNSIQAIGSTISYLERYTLFAILGLASSEDDLDGNVPNSCISLNQAADLRALAEEVGANIPKLLQVFKVEDFEYLPAGQHKNMMDALEAKRKQVEK